MGEGIKPPAGIPGQSPDDPRFGKFRRQTHVPGKVPLGTPQPEPTPKPDEERKKTEEPEENSPHKIDKKV
ncbi:hypothetical protein A3C18_00440 [Candidatus Kaiserbacteria bacterium RIFCSPHIGHO2_02_FULL_54_11b]|uniref:Uncharacterized protein n=2 Tax=Candidatus Kaiseribacteriota TaxID=1752734 RepID=A0A1F6CLH9_9BACT|nr:MAG: hypothetical protein A2704_06080 [Candidatus Kaiserbacteria bacterium RIFCSPHIGHO2_01_FULL_54_36b]OGG64330.1 MAG: hypothetical protein A3C18_00440 [Candidatus Kaiserbacteria bacterium RIFCSPHIGHO2_02_FULL_54_11b]